MKKVKIDKRTKLIITGIEGFLIRRVTKFGNGAKVDCPKEYLGRKVYLVIVKEDEEDKKEEEKEEYRRRK